MAGCRLVAGDVGAIRCEGARAAHCQERRGDARPDVETEVVGAGSEVNGDGFTLRVIQDVLKRGGFGLEMRMTFADGVGRVFRSDKPKDGEFHTFMMTLTTYTR